MSWRDSCAIEKTNQEKPWTQQLKTAKMTDRLLQKWVKNLMAQKQVLTVTEFNCKATQFIENYFLR